MSNKQPNTISSTPKLDQLFASMRYYSPTKKIDEKSMIDAIRQLGQDILADQYKNKSNDQSWERIQIDSQLISRNHSREVLRSQKLGTVFIESQHTKPSRNLYDKYKKDFYTQRDKKLINRTQQIVKSVKFNDPQLNKQAKYNHVAKKVYQKNQVNSLNYQKYVQKKVQKSRLQTHTGKQSFNSTARQVIMNRSLEQQQCFVKSKIVIPQKNIFIRGQEKRVIRESQRMKLVAQKQVFQLKEVTFFPQKIAKKQIREGISKQERQRVSSVRKQIRDRKIITEILQQIPLHPKTNNLNAESKIKSIWSSMQTLPRNKQKESQKSQVRYQSSILANSKSIHTSGTFSVRNVSQVKFLFN